jgi:hypothetical protein
MTFPPAIGYDPAQTQERAGAACWEMDRCDVARALALVNLMRDDKVVSLHGKGQQQ